MEKYRASKNNYEVEVPEKTEKEKKQEATEKVVDMAAEGALDYYTGGQFSQVKNKLSDIPFVGDKINKNWDGTVKKVSNVVSKTPVGDMLKKADDTGVTDTAKEAFNAYKSTKGGNISGNSNQTSKSSNDLKSLTTSSNKKNDKFLTSNIMSNFNFLGGTKFKLIIAAWAFLFVILIAVVTAIAAKDSANLDITNRTQMSRKTTSSADVMKALEEVSKDLIHIK